MLNNTLERLRAMKMSAFANELERQFADAENYNQIGFEDRLSLLVDCEWNRRQNNKLLRYIRNAHFSDAQTARTSGRSQTMMENNSAFSQDHKCLKWGDYELIRHELEEAVRLCHGNWIEI